MMQWCTYKYMYNIRDMNQGHCMKKHIRNAHPWANLSLISVLRRAIDNIHKDPRRSGQWKNSHPPEWCLGFRVQGYNIAICPCKDDEPRHGHMTQGYKCLSVC